MTLYGNNCSNMDYFYILKGVELGAATQFLFLYQDNLR